MECGWVEKCIKKAERETEARSDVETHRPRVRETETERRERQERQEKQERQERQERKSVFIGKNTAL